MMGGTSRDVELWIDDDGGDWAGDGAGVWDCWVAWFDGDVDVERSSSDFASEELGSEVGDLVSAGELLVASVLRETPRIVWISSLRSPFDSRKDILRSVGASRIDSSCRNLDAWSRRAGRSGVVEGESEFGDELESWLEAASPWTCCHLGMERFFDLSAMVR